MTRTIREICLPLAAVAAAGTVLAFVVVGLGCHATPQTTYTGGSVARTEAIATTPTWSPPATQRVLVTEGWFNPAPATLPAGPSFRTVEWTYFAPTLATARTETRTVATTQPSVSSSDTKILVKGSAITADGGLGPTSFSAIPIPKPPSGWWAYLFAISLAGIGAGCCYFGKWPLGVLLIGVGTFSLFVTTTMLTIILIVLAVLGTLVGVFFAYKHGLLQQAVAKIDVATADLAKSQPSAAKTVLDSHLDSTHQALLPKTVAAADAVAATTPAK